MVSAVKNSLAINNKAVIINIRFSKYFRYIKFTFSDLILLCAL